MSFFLLFLYIYSFLTVLAYSFHAIVLVISIVLFVVLLFSFIPFLFSFFFFYDTAPTEIYTSCHPLSLHDALPICSTETSNHSRSIYADAQILETSLLRQNSQLRGFLVTGDESYLKSYYEGRDEYDAASRKLESEITDDEELQQIGRAHV